MPVHSKSRSFCTKQCSRITLVLKTNSSNVTTVKTSTSFQLTEIFCCRSMVRIKRGHSRNFFPLFYTNSSSRTNKKKISFHFNGNLNTSQASKQNAAWKRHNVRVFQSGCPKLLARNYCTPVIINIFTLRYSLLAFNPKIAPSLHTPPPPLPIIESPFLQNNRISWFDVWWFGYQGKLE